MRLSNIADAGSFAQLIELTDTAVNFQIRSPSTDAVGVVYVVESADPTATTQRGSVTMTATGAANQSVSQAVTPVGALDAARVVLTGGEPIGPDVGCALVGGQLSTTAQLDLHRGDATADALVNYEIFEFPTTSAADTTPPTLSNPTLSAVSQTAMTAAVDTDEANGTLYCVISTSAAKPSPQQIQAGQNSTGAAAAWAGNAAVSAAGTITLNATGLAANTQYYAHFQHQDAAGNDSAVATSAAATTQSAKVQVTISGGANLTGLDYVLFDSQDLATAGILKQGAGESTDASGNLVIDVNDVSVTDGQAVYYVIGDTGDTQIAGGPATVSIA